MDLIVHDMQDDFLFTTEYVKIRPRGGTERGTKGKRWGAAPNFMLMLFVSDIHSRPPCLNSNLEETLTI